MMNVKRRNDAAAELREPKTMADDQSVAGR